MPKFRLTLSMLQVPLALLLASASLGAAACGSGSSGGGVVANVGDANVTRAEVNHWMATLASEDYYSMSGGHIVPAHLASDPARLQVCVSRLERTAASSPVNAPAPPGVRLLAKCRELYQALKLQAAGVLVTKNWYANVARDFGVTASAGEVSRFLARRDSELQPDDPRRHLLDAHQISHSDEMLESTVDLLYEKVQAKLHAGGSQAASRLAALERSWTGRTSCRPGYVVPHCAQYTNQAANPSASILMEQVAALATGRCINRPACSKQ
jgi:hypothetical protein